MCEIPLKATIRMDGNGDILIRVTTTDGIEVMNRRVIAWIEPQLYEYLSRFLEG